MGDIAEWTRRIVAVTKLKKLNYLSKDLYHQPAKKRR
jgi:hypothetical protein